MVFALQKNENKNKAAFLALFYLSKLAVFLVAHFTHFNLVHSLKIDKNNSNTQWKSNHCIAAYLIYHHIEQLSFKRSQPLNKGSWVIYFNVNISLKITTLKTIE